LLGGGRLSAYITRKTSTEERAMATRPKSEGKTSPTDARGKIVDALMELAAERRFEDISIRDICKSAGVSLADFRDVFPSKGAVVAGLSRRVDHAVLAQDSGELADENPRERLFDVLMRRLEAMAAYREGLREVAAWLRREPAAALAMNGVVMSSMRFMLEAAGIEAHGASGAVKLQGLALAWARVLQVWLDDDDPALSKTMAELDRVLTRGERAAAGVDRVSALASPFTALAQAAFEAGRRARRGGSRPARKDDPGDEDVTAL
jgi:AcrR family transcriptional regulator